ncbi:MAG TPA: hypothetical protein EYO73_01420 [Sulfurimonas sp.]|nr:hypothetical protein [Sulfurimonas sp.]
MQELNHKEEKSRLDLVEDKKLNEFLHLIPLSSFILSSQNIIVDYNALFEELFDPFSQDEILSSLRNKTLLLKEILSEDSKLEFKDYPQIWNDVYNELYEDSPLKVQFETPFGKKTYLIRISSINGLSDTLVCLESLA